MTQTDRLTYIHTGIHHTDRQIKTCIDKWTYRQTNNQQTIRQTDRQLLCIQTDIETDRHTDIHTYRYNDR